MSLCQPVIWSTRMATMLRDSTAAVVRTRPRAIPLAMITMRKSTHGFPFVFHIWLAYGAPLGGPSGRRSSAINSLNLLHLAFKSRNTTSSTCNLVSMLLNIGPPKSLFFVNIPHSDFRGLLICYREHVPVPKSVKKHSFAVGDRLTHF